MNNSFKKLFIEKVRENYKNIVIVSVLFVVGIIIGVIFINYLSINQYNELQAYVTSFMQLLKNDVDIEHFGLLKEVLLQNFILLLILWFVGATLIGLPILLGIIVFKGFCLGYTVAAIIAVLGASKGILFVVLALLAQNIIFIPAIIFMGVSGINLYKEISKNKGNRNIKLLLLRHSIISVGVLLVFVIASFIEVFVSTNLLKVCINLFNV